MKHIIGVCGPTGSGKTSVAQFLSTRYNTPILSFDNYSRQDQKNWEIPKAYNISKLIEDIMKSDKNVIVVEGFLLFVNRQLYSMLNHKIFVYIPTSEVVKRRMNRHNLEYRKITDEYLNEILIPYSRKYSLKQIEMSDLVIDGRKLFEYVTSDVINFLDKRIT